MTQGSKMAGKVRMFNMHETQAFLGHHHGEQIIHQPKVGFWGFKMTKKPNPKSARGYSVVNELVCLDPKKKVPNWVDVPNDYAHRVRFDGLGQGRLQPGFVPNDPEGKKTVNVFHHGGFLKTQDEVDVIITNEHEEAEKKLAEVRAKIAEAEKLKAALDAEIADKARAAKNKV